MNLELEADIYGANLTMFIARNNIPQHLYEHPDHIALKAANAAHFELLVKQISPKTEMMSFIEMDGRYLVAAKMAGRIAIGSNGFVEWVEIMEPKPEKENKDFVGLEHSEYYYPNFDEVEDVFKTKRISYALESNTNHSWISVGFSRGYEVKFTDTALRDIVAKQIESEEATLIPPPKRDLYEAVD